MKLRKTFFALQVLCVAAAISCSAVARADDAMPRKLAFYAAPRTSCAPDSSDRLADSCWAEAPVATTYYEYWKSNPALGALKSEMRLLYDERGVYVKVVNFDENMDKVRASIIRRDDPSLWTDDCAEIYFDPLANGVGFVVFTMNSLGVQSDRKRHDAAVMLDEWSGNEWRAATSKNDKSWTIDAFFPWSDLGRKAGAGDVWMFNHVRYAWSSGKFIGTTWAPGGNYQTPGKFGYLYFKGDEELSPETVGKVLSATAPPPWMLPTESGVLQHPAPGKMELTNADAMAAERRAALLQAISRAKGEAKQNAESQKQLTELEEKAKAISHTTSVEALDAVEQMTALQAEANTIYWRHKLNGLIESATAN